MGISKRAIALVFLLLSVVALSACHTVAGAGKDIQSGGRAVEDAGD